MPAKEFFGHFNFRVDGYLFNPPELIHASRGRVEVNEVLVPCVWSADSREGWAKTYDVLGDGRAHLSTEPEFNRKDMVVQHRAAEENWEVLPNGILSKTVKGKVRIFGPEDK